MTNSKLRIIEGYLYVYPYVGDHIFVHPEKIDIRSINELSRIFREMLEGKGISLLEILGQLEGKKVRITIEEKKITIEILE